jgi:hypothetical protein
MSFVEENESWMSFVEENESWMSFVEENKTVIITIFLFVTTTPLYLLQ